MDEIVFADYKCCDYIRDQALQVQTAGRGFLSALGAVIPFKVVPAIQTFYSIILICHGIIFQW